MSARAVATPLAALAIGISASAQVSDQLTPDLAQALAGRVAGKPVNCIIASRVSGPDLLDPLNIVYRESRTRLWRNKLDEKCPLLRENDILVVERFGDQLCRYDRFQIVNRNSGFASGYCILGAFTPYDMPKAPPKR